MCVCVSIVANGASQAANTLARHVEAQHSIVFVSVIIVGFVRQEADKVERLWGFKIFVSLKVEIILNIKC